jgi:hypothetical protein
MTTKNSKDHSTAPVRMMPIDQRPIVLSALIFPRLWQASRRTLCGEVIWRGNSIGASISRAALFHPQLVAEGGAGGRLTIRIHAFGHLKMAWHFYHWGDAFEVLAPQHQGK